VKLALTVTGSGKKAKIHRGMTQSSAKAKFTPMSIRIFSEMLGVQYITKQCQRQGHVDECRLWAAVSVLLVLTSLLLGLFLSKAG
jgi:hypothetical protein